MNENINRFMLDNSLAAVSAVRKDGFIFATDGKECVIHRFDLDGNFIGRTCVTRAYRRLRYFEPKGILTALGCNGEPTVYFTDARFNELGYIRLDTSESDSCKSLGCIVDATATVIAGECFIAGAFENAAYLFDASGKRLYMLCQADGCEEITDFIPFSGNSFAMSTKRGNLRSVTVNDSGVSQSDLLGCSPTLRMLFEENGEIYGLFGHSYIYNRISRIYSDGRISLPNTIENLNFSC